MAERSKNIVSKKFGGRVRVRAAGILLEEEGILLLKHDQVGPADFLWSPPGGGVDLGQDAEETVIREFKEETSIEVSVEKFLFVNEFIHLEHGLHAIELFFQVKRVAGELSLGLDPEMGSEEQILKEIAFFNDSQLRKSDKLILHNMFHGINKVEEVLNLKGYFKFVNNSIK